MLNGKELGAAIKSAIEKKIACGAVASQAAIARHFDVKPPSIHDWIKKGSISKDKLPELWRYFSDVVGPEHWGLKAWPNLGDAQAEATATIAWPFRTISQADVQALPASQLSALEGAIGLAIAQLKLGINVAPSPVAKPATLKSTPDYSDVEEPFPMRLREPMPWEPGGRTTQAEEAARSISTEASVLVNVAPGLQPAANDKFERVDELGDVRLAAGDGIENEQVISTGTVQFRRSFLREVGADGGRGVVVYAKGDSMEPVIHDGAALLLVPNDNLTLRDLAAGGVYAINYDGKMIVKCIVRDRLTRRWVGRSYNPAYHDIDLEGAESVRVLGRVVWTGSKLSEEDGAQWVKR